MRSKCDDSHVHAHVRNKIRTMLMLGNFAQLVEILQRNTNTNDQKCLLNFASIVIIEGWFEDFLQKRIKIYVSLNMSGLEAAEFSDLPRSEMVLRRPCSRMRHSAWRRYSLRGGRSNLSSKTVVAWFSGLGAGAV